MTELVQTHPLWRPAGKLLLVFTLLTGVLYPLAITGISQLAWSHEANGSLLTRDGHVIGSALLGQAWVDAKYFWDRPSATTPAYNAAASSGSNLGPTNPALLDAVKARVAVLREADPTQLAAIPADLVTSSGSGLDPEISPAAAYYQAPRVARLRGLDVAQVQQLVAAHVQGRTFGVLGEPRVNVLALNLALDALAHAP